jgi:geranylgeranyl pyrophosphate synthase
MSQLARSLEPENLALRLLTERFSERAADDAVPISLWSESLLEPLSDFLARPGKQFRARMVELAWELSGRRGSLPPELPLLVEVIHAGSLIVDDIEDDSTYRRGARTLHLDYGLPRALNAGNWLYFWPADLLAVLELPPASELALHRVIGRTLLSCHEGQALDLCTRVSELQQHDVPKVVLTTTRLKTGKLFELAAAVGAIAAGAPSSTLRAVSEFGMALGVGLQMLDDLGGIVSEKRCHKGHEDLLQARPTWPWAWAAERSDAHTYARLCTLGRQAASRERHPEEAASELRKLIEAEGRARVNGHLRAAFAELSQKVGRSRALDEALHEIEALEKSYG